MHPTGAKLFSGVLGEPTDISSHHLNAVDLVEEVAADRESEEVPGGDVVSSPMASKDARTYTVAATDDEWSFSLFP